MLRVTFLMTLLTCAVSPSTACLFAGEFMVLPVQTELQKVLICSSPAATDNPKAYVILDACDVAEEGKIDSDAIDLEKMRDALLPYADSKGGTVIINMYQKRRSPDLLTYAMKGFGEDAGFRHARILSTFDPTFDFKSHMAAIAAIADGEPEESEASTGNEILRVYPVATVLSRCLTERADCVVDVIRPIKQGDESLTAVIRDSALKEVPKANIGDKKEILFRIRISKSARNVSNESALSEMQILAQDLGYSTMRLSITPQP